MHLHLRWFPATLIVTAVFVVAGAQSAVANPFGIQSPLAGAGVDSAERPAVAAGGGKALVVWRERLLKGRGGGDGRIVGRFVDGTGTPAGDPIVVAEVCCGEPSRPDVAYNAARDEFLVVWRANLDGAFVFAQRVGSDGALRGERVPLTATGFDTSDVVRVAWAAGIDQYLVVWDQEQQATRGCCTDNEHVLGLRLRGEDAAPFPFEVPLALSDGVVDEDYPDAAFDAVSGKWLVAFTGDEASVQEERAASGELLFVTTVTAADAVDGPRPITPGEERVSRPSVAADPVNGGFAVAWSKQLDLGSRQYFDGDVVARRVDAAGNGAGSEVAVSPTDDLAYGSSPSAAFDPNTGELLVVWWQPGFDGTEQVLGRRFSSQLVALDVAQVLSVLVEPLRRGVLFSAARQPVVAYNGASCTFVSAYELAGSRNDVAARAFDAPDCPAPVVVKLNRFDSLVRGAETVAGSAASAQPARCTSRRVFLLRLVSRPGRRYRSATVTVNGKLVKRLSGGQRDALIDLEGLPAGTWTVRLAAKLADGRTLRYTRRYRTCSRKLKPSNRLERKEAV